MEQTNERWRPVKGYEGTFLVSDLGRVMNDHGLILKQKHDHCNNLAVVLKGKTVRVAKAVDSVLCGLLVLKQPSITFNKREPFCLLMK